MGIPLGLFFIYASESLTRRSSSSKSILIQLWGTKSQDHGIDILPFGSLLRVPGWICGHEKRIKWYQRLKWQRLYGIRWVLLEISKIQRTRCLDDVEVCGREECLEKKGASFIVIDLHEGWLEGQHCARVSVRGLVPVGSWTVSWMKAKMMDSAMTQWLLWEY